MSEGSVTQTKPAVILIVGLSVLLFSFLYSFSPQAFTFARASDLPLLERLRQTPVHLHDDVMVSLRSGRLLGELGLPAFNRTDLSQPSTSYAAPYLFAGLLWFLPDAFAVIAYALLGVLAASLTLALIVGFSVSLSNGIIMALALFLTKTHADYGFNGWDHLFQGLFLTLAAGLVLKRCASARGHLIVSVSLVLGVLFRPDGAILALFILAAMGLGSKAGKRFLIFGLMPAAGLTALCLAVNFAQFGKVLPTTFRLKMGASPSWAYSVKYPIENGYHSYTALTICLVLFAVYVLGWRRLSDARARLITLGCMASAAVAFFNSDAFPSARMFWTPACVMAVSFLASVPAAFRIKPAFRIPLAPGKIFFVFGLLAVLLFPAAARRRDSASVTAGKLALSREGQQYVITRWIRENLNPQDGSIGLFFLGMGYYLPPFEIADFLGKADELIAATPIKWGPPGHNKWDIDKTLDKWQPQAIVPPGNSESNERGDEDAAIALAQRRDLVFGYDLMLNRRVRENFAYCYIPDPQPGVVDRLGFYLRKDIARRHAGRLRCQDGLENS